MNGINVIVLMKISPICGEELLFPVGTKTRASDIDDEDILRMCTSLTEQANRWMCDHEGFPSWGDVGEEEILRRKLLVRILLLLVGGEVLLLL